MRKRRCDDGGYEVLDGMASSDYLDFWCWVHSFVLRMGKALACFTVMRNMFFLGTSCWRCGDTRTYKPDRL